LLLIFWLFFTANLSAREELSTFGITECATCFYHTYYQWPEQQIQPHEMVPFGKSNFLTMKPILITHLYKPRLNFNRNSWPLLSLYVNSTLIPSDILLLWERSCTQCVCHELEKFPENFRGHPLTVQTSSLFISHCCLAYVYITVRMNCCLRILWQNFHLQVYMDRFSNKSSCHSFFWLSCPPTPASQEQLLLSRKPFRILSYSAA